MKPTDYPEIIYKYRSWTNSNHKKILTDCQLYLASPKDFNDPFDCRIVSNFYLLDNEEKIRDFAEDISKKHEVAVIKMGGDPQKEKNRMINDLMTNLESFQSHSDKTTFEMQDDHFGVLSMSERFDSILMWSHYADLHKGFCVGFNEKRMRESNLFGKGGPINYAQMFPQIDPREQNSIEKSFKQTHTKAEDWAYEKEYRLTKLFFPIKPETSDRIVSFPKEFIKEIILGLNMPLIHRKEIIEIATHYKIKVYEMAQLPFQFKLIKKPVANTV